MFLAVTVTKNPAATDVVIAAEFADRPAADDAMLTWEAGGVVVAESETSVTVRDTVPVAAGGVGARLARVRATLQ